MQIRFSPVFDGLYGISHGFFTRRGGVSEGRYESLNNGEGSDDNAGHVAENRNRVARALGTQPEALLSCHQIHSTKTVFAESPWREKPEADAIVTRMPGIACTALAADCAPVLFADPVTGIIASAHAGWCGALAGVTDKTIETMCMQGANRKNIRAAIGPCISQANYEVGPEFVTSFLENDKTNSKFFSSGRAGRSHFDLKAYLLVRLRRAGITYTDALPDCTYADETRYFSYRRNLHRGISDYGRNISVIVLDS